MDDTTTFACSELQDNFPRYADMPYWFRKVGHDEYDVYLNAPSRKKIGTYLWRGNGQDFMFGPDGEHVSADEYAQVSDAFNEKFMYRPEWFATNLPAIGDANTDVAKFLAVEFYEKCLVGAAYLRAWDNGCEDPDTCWSTIKKCLDWLRSTDFYEAPASTRYHEAFAGGLLVHSLKVAKHAIELFESEAFSIPFRIKDRRGDYGSVILVALVHDWCKIHTYESYQRNVKDETTGEWVKEIAYRRRATKYVPMGHGEASVFMASKFFKLSLEDSLAIRWHMGHWRVADDDVDELQYANETYPMVHLIQFADQLAITQYHAHQI